MSHTISRNVPTVPSAVGGTAGPLTLADTTRTEWDILMTRQDRWITCRSGITDPKEVARELEWFSAYNPSASVTYHVLERTIALHERLLKTPPSTPSSAGPGDPPAPSPANSPGRAAATVSTPPAEPAPHRR